jgi:hypothetical protein
MMSQVPFVLHHRKYRTQESVPQHSARARSRTDDWLSASAQDRKRSHISVRCHRGLWEELSSQVVLCHIFGTRIKFFL